MSLVLSAKAGKSKLGKHVTRQLPGSKSERRSARGNDVAVVIKTNTHDSGYLTSGTSQTKLLFNEAVPASVRNRATAVGPPAAIVIEKLRPLPPADRQKEAEGGVKSSLGFSSLSEERLQAAVDLVKRDLRRSRFQAMCRSSADPPEEASVLDICNMTLPQMTGKLSLKERLARPGSQQPAPVKRLAVSKQIGRPPASSRVAAGVDQQHFLRQEVYKLQKELEKLKKGLNPEAGQPQDMPKKPPRPFRSRNLQPSSPKRAILKTTDNPDQQEVLRQEIFKLQNDGLQHSDGAFVQGGTSNSSDAKKSTDNISKKPLIASKSLWTKDPIPKSEGTADRRTLLGQEMCKLDAELQSYTRQVEKLSDRVISRANNENYEDEQLEPDERKKLEMRWQKLSERSARTIYCLQQQVKEVQQYIEKLHNQDVWEEKKSTAIRRLAGAHRGTLKALQVVTRQLAHQYHNKLPSCCGDLSRLICQLTLCSARVQVEPGSPLPETAGAILSKLEILDHSITKHKTLQAMQDRAYPQQRKPSTGAPEPSGAARRLPKGANLPKSSHARRIARQKEQGPGRPAHLQGAPQQHKRKPPGKKKKHQPANVKDPHFKEPTVSSRLRVNQLPHRESTVPWIPASSHSLSPPRSCHKTTSEPRCLSSPAKPSSSSSPPKGSVGFGSIDDTHVKSEKQRQAQSEALRGAWLDKMTAQRLEDLNRLTREEAERIQRLRAEVVSPTEWAERAERRAREKIRPLLREAKAAEGAEQAGEDALEENLSEEAARRALRGPALEGMLERMEEIQRDQEEVRRRVASVAYSDALQWSQPAGPQVQVQVLGSRPGSPKPIRLTRPVLRQAPAADIFLEEPVEAGVLTESSLTEEASGEVVPPMFPGREGSGAARTVVISVPGSMLRSIRHYREDYEAYLRRAAHQGGSGDVNSWAIADSLAEELLRDAAADVAAEFQDVTEECAEAVFTAEFLQLIRSPGVASSSSSSSSFNQ
ncbi:protein moonraker [Syngnathoides biaculeatus]|uniref:protein moonraker n=1 Tax=Syngnathoides biaculeatus TaxID=300417 RepID=UPI002ADD973E|nr:protein moonraker [Syngnathoides biaculeatus]